METDEIISDNLHENVSTIKNTFSEHGNEIEEIISAKTPPLVRWGTVYFLFILLAMAAICWFIQYPDIINTKVKLTSINAPKEVITKTAGKLVKLFVKEGDEATSGNILGYIESTADHKEIIILSTNIDTITAIVKNNRIDQLLPFLNVSYENLGELQQPYQNFLQSFIVFRNYISGGFYLTKKILLSKDLAFYQRLHGNLLKQKELNNEDVELSEKTFTANQSLKDDKVISDFDYRNERSKLIGKKLTLPQVNAAIINNEAQQNEKQKEIMDLENTIAQQKSIFYQSLNTFKSQMEDWKKKYMLTAPVSGRITFATFLQENQQLQVNQIICFVNPENTHYYAEMYIPQANFGKVKHGQEVLLKFASYPFEQYGIVNGKIDYISNVSTDSGYLAKVILPRALTTSYNKQVQFREGLRAQGEIITKDMRLLERFYYSIIKQVKQ